MVLSGRVSNDIIIAIASRWFCGAILLFLLAAVYFIRCIDYHTDVLCG